MESVKKGLRLFTYNVAFKRFWEKGKGHQTKDDKRPHGILISKWVAKMKINVAFKRLLGGSALRCLCIRGTKVAFSGLLIIHLAACHIYMYKESPKNETYPINSIFAE